MSQSGILNDNTGGLTIPVTVPEGGTGQVTFPAHTVLIGEGVSPIGNAGPGALGSVLTGQGAGVDPIFVPVISILGGARAASTTATSTATVCSTETTPTTSNTDDLISLTYAASSASSILEFEFNCPYTVAGSALFALFSGTTFVQAFPFSTTTIIDQIANNAHFKYSMVSGSTSSTTYHIRFATSVNTLYLLQDSMDVFFGASGNTSIQFSVKEYSA
jgi:hypothetical protein